MSLMRCRCLSALMASSLVLGCLGEEDPAGSEVENEVTVGRLYLADGKPAVNARVRIYPVDHLPQDGALPKTAALSYSTFTDASGRYRIDSLQSGEYNILGELDGNRSLRDSVYLSASPQALPPDTLDAPGSLSGVVALQPNHDLRTVTLQLLGTNEYANADRQGRFTFSNLAEGRYRMRVTTTEPNYTALFANVAARAGRSDTLADTLRPDFTGIPVVTGVRAAFDTAAGLVHLTWRPADYARFSRYQVFRDLAGSQVLSTVSIGSTRDTAFTDTLFRNGWPAIGQAEDSAFRVEYRVRVVNLSDIPGLSYGAVEIAAAQPDRVTTRLSMRLADSGLEASIGDTLVLVARYDNPTRGQKELRWYSLPGGSLLRTARVDGLGGTDTLRFAAPDTAGQLHFRLEATDEAGDLWASHQHLSVVTDPPKAHAGSDTAVFFRGSRVALHGRGEDRFGRIVKWEWDIGARGDFFPVRNGDTAFTMDSIPESGLSCVLRVTDDDGQSARDTLVVKPHRVRLAGTWPAARYDMAAAALNGRIYVLGGVDASGISSKLEEFDPVTGAWTARAAMPTARRGLKAIAANGRIYALGGRKADGSSGTHLEEYNPASDRWTMHGDYYPGMLVGHASASTGNLYVLTSDMQRLLARFEFASNQWKSGGGMDKHKGRIRNGECGRYSSVVQKPGGSDVEPEYQCRCIFPTIPISGIQGSGFNEPGCGDAFDGFSGNRGGLLFLRRGETDILPSTHTSCDRACDGLDPAGIAIHGRGEWRDLHPGRGQSRIAKARGSN